MWVSMALMVFTHAGSWYDALLRLGVSHHNAHGGSFKTVSITRCSCFLADECLHLEVCLMDANEVTDTYLSRCICT